MASRRVASSTTKVRRASATRSSIEAKKYDAVASGSPARSVTARWVVPATRVPPRPPPPPAADASRRACGSVAGGAGADRGDRGGAPPSTGTVPELWKVFQGGATFA